ncbi:MAG: AsmA family protein, partial [Deltaproteobacteria bacterium]|nr:AsmA family protein [Deltaproteobacteria bacterium]
MKKGTKIVAIGILSFFLLLIAAAFILPYLISLDRYKGMIEARLGGVLQREVSLEGLRITILPTLGAKIENLVISNISGFSPTPFLSLRVLKVRVKLLPLLVGRKEIAGLTLQKPKVFIERDKGGRLNIPLMDEKIKRGRRGRLKSARVKTEESKVLQGLFISKASIKGGNFVYLDRAITPARRTEIEKIDLDLRDLSLKKRIKYDLSLKWAPGDLSLEGWLGPLGETIDLKRTPLEGRLRVDLHRPDDLIRTLAGEKGPALHGGLKVDLNFQGDTGSALKVQGEIFLKALSLEQRGEKLIQDLDLLLRPEADLCWEKGELGLKSTLQIEETPFQIEGEFRDLQRRPSGKLTFFSKKGFDLEELGPKFPPLQKVLNLKGDLALKGNLRIHPQGPSVLSLEANSSQMEIALVR